MRPQKIIASAAITTMAFVGGGWAGERIGELASKPVSQLGPQIEACADAILNQSAEVDVIDEACNTSDITYFPAYDEAGETILDKQLTKAELVEKITKEQDSYNKSSKRAAMDLGSLFFAGAAIMEERWRAKRRTFLVTDQEIRAMIESEQQKGDWT